MKKFFAIIIAVAMLATVLAVSVSATGLTYDGLVGGKEGVLTFDPTTTTPGADLNVKVSDVTHKYAVDVQFNITDLTIGGTITWNVETMKYDVKKTDLVDTTRTVTVYNRSDLPVYAFATVTDENAIDGITVAAATYSETNKLTIAKATAGTAAAHGIHGIGELTINVTSGDWNAVAEYYAAKKLNSADQTDTFKIATVTVTITQDD